MRSWPIRYREAGQGPVVVLAHGLGVANEYWRRNGPPLAAAGYRVLAPDFPGFGRTPGPARGLSVSDQVRILLDWADALEIGRAVYVGHSISCQVALELAANHPERVGGLVLAAPTGDPARFRLLRQAWGLLRDIPRESLKLALVVAQAYLRAGPFRVWGTWRMGAEHEVMPLLARVHAPGVVIVGTRDPVVDPAFAHALAERLPEGRVVWIPGGSHAVIHDTADEFNRAVLAFLARIDEAGAGDRLPRGG